MGFPVETMLDFIELRKRPGSTGVTVLVMGGLTLPPENYGPFYWKADSVAPDDNRDIIKCDNVDIGRYLRAFTSGGVSGTACLLYNATFLLSVANQVYVIPQNANKYIKGRLIKSDTVNNTQTTFDGIGLAKISIEANIIKGGGNGSIDFWLRKNGQDILDTRRTYAVAGNGKEPIVFIEEFDVVKGDYIEVVAVGTDNSFQLQRVTQSGRPDVLPFKMNVNLYNPIVI